MRISVAWAAVGAALALFLGVSGTALGQGGPPGYLSLSPTTTADVPNPAPGQLSLRAAVAEANATDAEAAITLQPGAVYRLTDCTAGPLTHTNPVHGLTIDANGATIEQTCPGQRVLVQLGNGLFNIVQAVVHGGGGTGPGGTLYSAGSGEVRFTNSVLSDGSGGGNGAAIWAAGEVNVSGATISGIHGQGQFLVQAGGRLGVYKTTMYGNSAAGTLSGAKAVILFHDTLLDQPAPTVSAGRGLTAFASVLSPADCQISGPVTSYGYNFLTGPAAASCGLRAAGDRVSKVAPGLRPETGIGGDNVLTPVAGSPLVDRIPAAKCLPRSLAPLIPVYTGSTSDQLGVPTPIGPGCDIGAIERATRASLVRKTNYPHRTPDPVHFRPFAPPRFRPGGQLTLTVTTTRDELRDPDGRLSLREAFNVADRSRMRVTIRLQPRGVYPLDVCAPPFTAQPGSENELSYSGALPLTVDGEGSTIEQLCGGASVIENLGLGELRLVGVKVMGGRSTHLPGGGIYSAGIGVVSMVDSALVDNTTVAAGGGMATFGDVYLYRTTIAHNHSDEVAGAVAALGHVFSADSSVFDNTAALGNGGLEGGNGVTLVYSTVTRNSGTQIEAFGAHLTAFGSIVAGRGGPNCHVSHAAVSLGWNVNATDGGHSCLFGSAPHVLQPAGVRLTSVAGILGVPVLAPATGSPMIDAIPAADCSSARVARLLPGHWNLRVDEVGTSRPRGRGCDIGAIERSQGGRSG